MGVAVRDRLHARPARRVAALPGFPRHETLRVRIAIGHSVFLSLLAQIAQPSYFLPEIHRAAQRETSVLGAEQGIPGICCSRLSNISNNWNGVRLVTPSASET